MLSLRCNLVKFTKNAFNLNLISRQISNFGPILSKFIIENKIKTRKNNQILCSYLSSSSQKSNSTSSEQSELIVQHLSEGIVELQLNRSLGKNALSKKLLFEVR